MQNHLFHYSDMEVIYMKHRPGQIASVGLCACLLTLGGISVSTAQAPNAPAQNPAPAKTAPAKPAPTKSEAETAAALRRKSRFLPHDQYLQLAAKLKANTAERHKQEYDLRQAENKREYEWRRAHPHASRQETQQAIGEMRAAEKRQEEQVGHDAFQKALAIYRSFGIQGP
jgi:hypothetical protein